ncbi:hypothetical protein [Limnoglobus roseus]|uniref:Uncharacterized protein n=1 Tax=Limnoglobus roseus TaxID=2598579 RepID=A0A5C1AMZ1_9BACT|nr:hypothetical protein [Limnoglobus roseus]QEL19507.1 hypothetical protein PX52LOC_06581 [Limnoglobus roseus]
MGLLPSELAARCTMADWWLMSAFAEIEPFGGAQDDLRAAVSAIIPARAFNGEAINPASLFHSLGDGEKKADKKNIGRGFRAWASSQCASVSAIGPSQRAAEA